MKKIFILLILFYIASYSSARYGIGYYFFNRLVAKKVYAKSTRNFRSKSKIQIKMKQGLNFIDDFTMSLSKFGVKRYSSIREFRKRVSHPLRTTEIKRVLRIQAFFKEAWNNYVELKPKRTIILPKWTKSIDFWAYGINKKLDVYVYLSTKPNNIMRFKMGRLNYEQWQKMYANIYNLTYKNERQIRLVKIRIVGHRYNAVKDFITYFAGFKVYNFNRNAKNLYLDPIYTIYDINNADNINWKLQIGQNRVDRNFFRRVFDQDINKSILHIAIPKQLHKELDTFIFFTKPLYVYKKYKVSIWIKGNNNNEYISLIFRDTKKRLFEVEFAKINFKGWTRLSVKVPNKFFLNRPGYIRPPYITLWGLKISPKRNTDIEFRIDNITSYNDYRFTNIIKRNILRIR